MTTHVHNVIYTIKGDLEDCAVLVCVCGWGRTIVAEGAITKLRSFKQEVQQFAHQHEVQSRG